MINVKFIFLDDNQTEKETIILETEPGQTVLEIVEAYRAQTKRTILECACHGCCVCSTCHIYIDDIDQPVEELEEDCLDIVENFVENRSRLGCQVIINKDCTIYIPPSTRSRILDL